MSNISSSLFDGILDQAIKSEGKIALPNIKLLTPEEGIQAVCNSRDLAEVPYRFKIQEFSDLKYELAYYPKIFRNARGMSGRFDGSGVILASGKAYSFAICEHEWDEFGANHMRGWHPAICKKCRFDASIDSGD